MQRTQILLAIVVVLVAAFLGLVIFQQDELSDYVRPFILPMVTVLYCTSGNCRRNYFFYFLLFYAISEFLAVFYYYGNWTRQLEDIFYYACNSLYIMAYIALTMEVLKTMDLSTILKRFSVHIVILIILDIYCVVLVTDVAVKSGALEYTVDKFLEAIYNIVIMALLTITLVNYLHRDTKKAMNLLLGSLCIVFSEVIQVAYYYVSEMIILGIAYNILLVLAFVFFYMQVGLASQSCVHEEQHLTSEAEA